MDVRAYLGAIGTTVKDGFSEQRSLLSFEEYLQLFDRAPRTQARGAAQYLRDAIEHFGTARVDTPWGEDRRFGIFDLGFAPEARASRVAGQEEVQAALHRVLGNFVRTGRVNKLILLHGPNGSAKSSLVTARRAQMAS